MSEDALLLVRANQRRGLQHPLVFDLLIGEQPDRVNLSGFKIPGTLAEQAGKGAGNIPFRGLKVRVELLSPPFLGVGHPPFSAQVGIIRAVKILRFLSDEQMDVVGKVLGLGKALKTVRNKVFLQRKIVPQRRVQGNRLAGKPPDPVHDDFIGHVIHAGKRPDAGSALGEVAEKLVVGQMFFDPVIDRKGLG